MPTQKTDETRQAQFAEITAIFDRAGATLAQMGILAEKWTWDTCPPDLFEQKMAQIRGGPDLVGPALDTLYTQAEFDENHGKGDLARALKRLHSATVTCLGVARVVWEGNPEAAEILSDLSASGQVEDDIFDEAERWEIAWEEIDPDWTPKPGTTLPVFTALIATAREARRASLKATFRRQRAEVRLSRAVRELDQLQKRWYGVATAIFDEETSEGEGIRAQIPTTYVPRYAAAAKRRRKERKAAAAAAASTPPPAEEPPANAQSEK